MDKDIDILISSEESLEQWEPIPLYIEAPSPSQCDIPSQKEEGEDGCVIIIDIAGEEE